MRTTLGLVGRTHCVTSSKESVDTEFDPIIVHPKRRPQLVGEVKEVNLNGRKFKIGGGLSLVVEAQIL